MIKAAVIISQISPIIAAIICVLVGAWVFLINPRNNRNKLFFAFSVMLFIWAYACFVQSTTGDPAIAYIYDLILYAGAVFAPSIFLHLAAQFTGKNRPVLIGFSYFASAALFALNFTPLFRSGVVHLTGNRFVTMPGIGWYVYVAFFSAVVCLALFDLVALLQRSVGRDKTQSYYLILSFLFLIVGGISYYSLIVFSVVFPYDAYLNLISSIALAFYQTIIAYSITRYRLMDIDVIIRRGILYTAITTVVTGLYVMAIYTSNFLFSRIPGFNVLWFMLPAIFFLALLFQPIKNRLQDFLDRNFFKTKYESDKIAHKFSEGVKKLKKTKELAEYISRSAMQTFKLFGAACFVYSEEKMEYVCEDARGSLAGLKGSQAAEDLEIIRQMKSAGHMIVAEELRFAVDKTRRVRKDDNKDRLSIQKMLEEMLKFNAAIAVPSISKKKDYKLIAFLVADRKKSDDAFSGSDITLLENLSGQVVVSIENAMLYEEQFKTIAKSMSIEKLADLGKATAGVASEAQNALSYIEWFSKQLPEKKNDREFLLANSKTLFAEVEKMRLLMQGVLEFSRPSALKIEKISACKALDDVKILVQETAAKRGIGISVSCEEGLEMSADKSGMKQILLNLLMNAIESMPGGGQLSVKSQTQDGAPVIYISDTGHGIPSHVQQRIFEPFFTTKEHGIGLGLSIVGQSLKAMNGTISFESEQGKGTTVKVVLQPYMV